MIYKRVRATSAGIPNALTGRDITEQERGEGVRVTPFILRKINNGELVEVKKTKRRKKIKTPETKEPIDG